MRRDLRIATIFALVLVVLILAACGTQPEATPTPEVVMLLGTPVGTSDQETLAAALTQEKINADSQAAATAEIVRANAQATLNSANATLSAARTQEQNNADLIAAQIAGTAEIVRADAQATLNSSGLTQSAALTQAQSDLQSTEAAGTQGVEAVMTQQNKNDLAASTQTAVANNIATQTQVAAATSQWYADQARQHDEQWGGPLTFLWRWCFPIFILLLGGLGLWGIWRWLKIQQANQSILEIPTDKLPARASEIINHQHDDELPNLDSDVVDSRYQLTKPDDQVHRWLDEVKSKLLSNDKKDEDDSTDN